MMLLRVVPKGAASKRTLATVPIATVPKATMPSFADQLAVVRSDIAKNQQLIAQREWERRAFAVSAAVMTIPAVYLSHKYGIDFPWPILFPIATAGACLGTHFDLAIARDETRELRKRETTLCICVELERRVGASVCRVCGCGPDSAPVAWSPTANTARDC